MLIKKSHPILKVIFKYSKHPRFIPVNNVTDGLTFQFLCDHVDGAFTHRQIKGGCIIQDGALFNNS